MTNAQKMEWALRIGVAGEFAGHGWLGLYGKADWVKWVVQLAHVSNPTAHTIVVAIGVLDLIIAVIVLVRPINPILLWAAFWGFATALVRPIVGVGWPDFVERFANWGAPLALYYFYKSKNR